MMEIIVATKTNKRNPPVIGPNITRPPRITLANLAKEMRGGFKTVNIRLANLKKRVVKLESQ
ncbi:MAG: hypothetical protein LBF00_00260 [Mycoplasmataceae bacterium]|jgi:hypothetical protein|nr:hypothetical protein [Mycoplasmataceae bacterium]